MANGPTKQELESLTADLMKHGEGLKVASKDQLDAAKKQAENISAIDRILGKVGGGVDPAKTAGGGADLGKINITGADVRIIDARNVSIPGLPETLGNATATAIGTFLANKLSAEPISFKGLKESAKDPISLFGGPFQAATESIPKITDETAKLRRETLGFGSDFKKNIKTAAEMEAHLKRLGTNLAAMGMRGEDAVKVLEELRSNSKQLNVILTDPKVPESFRTKMAAYTIPLKQYGASAEDIGKAIDSVFQGVDPKNLKDVDARMNKMVSTTMKLSKTLKVPFGKMLGEVGGSMEDLRIYGFGPMMRNMAELQVLSKRTGISMESFQRMTGKFDRIDDASEAIANMNALLRGTSLDINEMMTAEPAEQMKMIMGEFKTAIDEGRFEVAESGRQRYLDIAAAAEGMGFDKKEIDTFLRKNVEMQEMLGISAEAHKTEAGAIATVAREREAGLGAQETQARVMNEAVNTLSLNKEKLVEFVEFLQKSSANIMKNRVFKTLSTDLGGLATGMAKINTASLFFGEGNKERGIIANVLFGNEKMISNTLANFASVSGLLASFRKELDALGQWATQNVPAGVPEAGDAGTGKTKDVLNEKLDSILEDIKNRQKKGEDKPIEVSLNMNGTEIKRMAGQLNLEEGVIKNFNERVGA